MDTQFEALPFEAEGEGEGEAERGRMFAHGMAPRRLGRPLFKPGRGPSPRRPAPGRWPGPAHGPKPPWPHPHPHPHPGGGIWPRYYPSWGPYWPFDVVPFQAVVSTAAPEPWPDDAQPSAPWPDGAPDQEPWPDTDPDAGAWTASDPAPWLAQEGPAANGLGRGEQGWFEVLEVAPGGPFSEAEELELAYELLAVSNEAELDQFLGKVFSGAWKGIKKVGSSIGKALKPLGGVLKGVAKTALPFVGGALGSFIPIPGVGTALGTALGGALSQALEMETMALDAPERELEMARRFVRIAGTAARQLAQARPDGDRLAQARRAVAAALREHVPAAACGQCGAWQRQGGRIVVRL